MLVSEDEKNPDRMRMTTRAKNSVASENSSKA
jgi:hypothetical protein